MELKINKFAELQNRTLTTPCAVIGMNGAGKTTMMNAYLWCLTGKGKDGSEAGKSVYSKKDEGDKRIADVEVILNDKRFQRICRPTYMRKKGTDEQTLKALCATTYILDGVEVTKAEYDNAVSDLCGGRDFQLFTDINYFVNLKKDKQLEIFMELLNVNRGDFFGDTPEIGELKKRLKEIDEEKKRRISFKTISEENLREMPNFEDFTEKILEIKAEIDDLINQRPTLTADQIDDNNKILAEIAKLQAEPLNFTISNTKRDNLDEKKVYLQHLYTEWQSAINDRACTEVALRKAKEDMEKWGGECEFSENTPEFNDLRAKIDTFLAKKEKDAILLENYAENLKNASCGLCPHCDDIFCEHKVTDLPSKADLIRNITEIDNKIADLRVKMSKMRDDWQKNKEDEHKEIAERISRFEEELAKIDVEGAKKAVDDAEKALEVAKIEYAREVGANSKARENRDRQFAENNLKIAELRAKMHTAEASSTDDKIADLKVKLADFEAKQRDFDQNNGAKITLSNNIADNDERIENLIYQRIKLEKDIMRYEDADKNYRNAIQQKASEMMPKGMSINLFRPLITGDGYEQVFEITYDDKEYKNTALEIWGNYQLTNILQKGFGVHLPIFVDDVANIVNEDLLPKGDDTILLVAVKDCDLEIVPNSELRGII